MKSQGFSNIEQILQEADLGEIFFSKRYLFSSFTISSEHFSEISFEYFFPSNLFVKSLFIFNNIPSSTDLLRFICEFEIL